MTAGQLHAGSDVSFLDWSSLIRVHTQTAGSVETSQRLVSAQKVSALMSDAVWECAVIWIVKTLGRSYVFDARKD